MTSSATSTATNTARRQVLMAELEDAVRQRDELDAYIAVLSTRLGIEPPKANNGAPDLDPAASVREGQFYGKSAPKAAKALLQQYGSNRPLKTDEIFAAITKGGVQIGSASTLYRSLTRDADFHLVGRGVWGLSEEGDADEQAQQAVADPRGPAT